MLKMCEEDFAVDIYPQKGFDKRVSSFFLRPEGVW
jgi:hypothetical protein